MQENSAFFISILSRVKTKSTLLYLMSFHENVEGKYCWQLLDRLYYCTKIVYICTSWIFFILSLFCVCFKYHGQISYFTNLFIAWTGNAFFTNEWFLILLFDVWTLKGVHGWFSRKLGFKNVKHENVKIA